MTNNEKFECSITFSLKWEGGLIFYIQNGKPVLKGNSKADLGGATAYGITWNTLRAAFKKGIVSHDNICRLTLDEAKLIYLSEKIHSQRKIYYEKIVVKKTSQSVFLKGWLKRNDDMLKEYDIYG